MLYQSIWAILASGALPVTVGPLLGEAYESSSLTWADLELYPTRSKDGTQFLVGLDASPNKLAGLAEEPYFVSFLTYSGAVAQAESWGTPLPTTSIQNMYVIRTTSSYSGVASSLLDSVSGGTTWATLASTPRTTTNGTAFLCAVPGQTSLAKITTLAGNADTVDYLSYFSTAALMETTEWNPE